MAHIGNIIKECRSQINMSRSELAEGICTEKYVYLIEKNERTPSCEILFLFAERIGVNLSRKFEYADCTAPLLVKKHTEEIRLYRSKLQLESLEKATNNALLLEDFNNLPWKYEIILNEFCNDIFFKQEYNKSISELNVFLDEAKKQTDQHIYCRYVLSALILLSVAYILKGDLIKAKQANVEANNIAHYNFNKSNRILFMNLRLSTMILYYLMNEYDHTIQEGEEIIECRCKENLCDRIYYAYFYTSYAYFKMGEKNKAIEHFIQGLHMGLIDDLTNHMRFLIDQGPFSELINDESINKELRKVFVDKYASAALSCL